MFLLSVIAFGADPGLPGCDARPEVRQVIERDLDGQKLDAMKVTEQDALRERVLTDLIARFPREPTPHERLMDSARWDQPEQFPAIQERYRKMASENPDDPVALYLAAYALFRTGTPEIRFQCSWPDVANRLYDGWAIPKNWLVDPAGKWRWVEVGYDSAEPDWVGSMRKRVEDLKKPDKTD
jgi:hypothetical protein